MGAYIPYNEDSLKRIADEVKSRGEILAITGGSFDLDSLHQVHIAFLRRCKTLCNNLVVNVVNDQRVKLYKRDSIIPRPIFAEETRARSVSSIDVVDYVTIHPYIGDPYNEEDIGPTERLAFIMKPNIIIKGKNGWNRKSKNRIRDFLGYDIEFREIKIKEDITSTSFLEYLARAVQGTYLEKKII